MDAGSGYHVYTILVGGFIATGVLTTILEASQKFGWSRISLPFMLGTFFTVSRRRADVYGFAVHFLNGWVFAFLYGLVFDWLGLAGWWFGGLLGLFHGVMMLAVVMVLLPNIHPRMADERFGPSATRWLEPPGFLALNYGRRTPLVTLVAHVVYGLILGAIY